MPEAEGPITLYKTTAKEEWMDYNGHMNVAWYVHVFDKTMDAFLAQAGLGRGYAEKEGASVFALQNHLHYMREVHAGEELSVSLQMMDLDEKRIHVFLRMMNGAGVMVATSELLVIHVDMKARRSSPIPRPHASTLAGIFENHKALPPPRVAGHRIGTTAKL